MFLPKMIFHSTNLYRTFVPIKFTMKHKIITSAIIWTGLYPVLLLVSTLLHPFIGSWHFALKTLITTLIVVPVPVMVFFIIPLVRKLFILLGIVKES